MKQLPPGWRLVTLNDIQAAEPRAITDGPFGSNLTGAHYTDFGPRVVRLQNIGDGIFHDAHAHISEQHFQSLRAHEVLPGDLLIASLGEILPRACLAPPQLGPAIVKADCIRVRLSPDVDRRWVMYALQRPSARKWAEAHRHGVGRPRLGLKTIRQIPVPLPPIAEQQRILDVLEDRLSRLDAAFTLIGNAHTRAGTWRKSALLRSILGGDMHVQSHQVEKLNGVDLGGPREPRLDLPNDWTWRKWREVGTCQNGKAFPSGDYRADGVRLLRPGNMGPHGRLQWTSSATRYLPRSYRSSHATLLLSPKDIVMNLTAQSLKDDFLGRACLVTANDEALLNQRVARLRSIDALPEFALAVFRSPLFRLYVKSLNSGSLIQHMFTKQVNEFWFPIPPKATQERIVRDANEHEADVTRLETATRSGRHRAVVLRRSLLDAAFSGRLTCHPLDAEVIEETAGV